MYKVGGTLLTITVSIGLARLTLGRRDDRREDPMVDADMYANKVSLDITQSAAAALLTDFDALSDMLRIGWGEE